MSNLDWPPPYTIRKSRRTKRMSLRISKKGLEIVIPTKLSQQRAIDFLEMKKEWVQTNRHLIPALDMDISLPDTILLSAINEEWRVNYCLNEVTQQQSRICESDANELSLVAENKTTAISLLKQWLREKAKLHLTQLVSDCSKKYRLSFNSVKVRYQQTRWGSCSKEKNINLNCKLMLLPFEAVYYVVIHELVHTIHLDHSAQFWAAVQKIVPNYQTMRNLLKTAEPQLPKWLDG